MARILCVITGLKGMTNTTFALLDRLQNLGHDVFFSTYRDFEEQNIDAPFRYFPLAKYRRYDSSILPESRSGNKALRFVRNAFSHTSMRNQLGRLLEEDLKVYEQVIDLTKPDLVFVDIEMPAHIALNRSRQMPTLIISQFFIERTSDELPPLSSSYIPLAKASSRKIIRQAWIKIAAKNRKKAFKALMRFQVTQETVIEGYLNRKAKNLIGSFKKNLYFSHTYSFYDIDTLHTTYQELEWPASAQLNRHYIGGLVHKKREDLEEANQGLINVLNLKNKSGQKLICISFSTMEKSNESGGRLLIKQLIKAIGKNQNYVGIIAGSQEWLIAEIESYKNVHSFEKMPLLTVLKHADCSINHGGMNTINECIEYNVPMLLYSGNQHDQNGCMARMQYHNMAVIGDEKNDTVEDIKRKIEQAMNSKTIKANMQALTSPETKQRYRNKLETLVNQALAS